MSAVTPEPLLSQRFLTPPLSGEHEIQQSQSERGRKRRRSSAANQASQLPSNTLRGRARRRSSSIQLTSIIDGPHLIEENERHRSKSPSRRSHVFGKEGEARTKYVRKTGPANMFEIGEDKIGARATEHSAWEPKKRRDQSPSRSRSHGHEGDAKARRRQRTRSRSRSHGRAVVVAATEKDINSETSRVTEQNKDLLDEVAVED